MQPTLEQVRFRTQEDVTEDALLQAAETTSSWLKQQPGFSYRTLVCDTDGTWTDLIYWSSLENAKAASEAFMGSVETKPFMALIDPETVKMQHFSMLHLASRA